MNKISGVNSYSQNMFTPSPKNGVHYFFMGWSLAFKPGIKKFVFLPMLANIIIVSIMLAWSFSIISRLVNIGLLFVPGWLHWFSGIITFLIILMMVILFCYFFSVITNIIAAPFNGLLAEQVEARLTGMPAPNSSWFSLIKDLPRILYREMQKLLNYLLWAIPLLFTYLIPVIGQTITPVVWFLFTAWWMNIQYADYAFDNHKIRFRTMKRLLKQDRVDNLLFGSLVSLFTMLPLFNLIIMPIAVCGATAMWVDRYRKPALLDISQFR